MPAIIAEMPVPTEMVHVRLKPIFLDSWTASSWEVAIGVQRRRGRKPKGERGHLPVLRVGSADCGGAPQGGSRPGGATPGNEEARH